MNLFNFSGDKYGCSSLGTPSVGGHYRPLDYDSGSVDFSRVGVLALRATLMTRKTIKKCCLFDFLIVQQAESMCSFPGNTARLHRFFQSSNHRCSHDFLPKH